MKKENKEKLEFVSKKENGESQKLSFIYNKKTGLYKSCNSVAYKMYTGLHVIVPKGTETNFASVPKFLRWLIKPRGEQYWEATFLHDFLYSKGKEIGVSRKEADTQMFRMQAQTDLNVERVITLYAMARLFGYFHYNRNKNICSTQKRKNSKKQ